MNRLGRENDTVDDDDECPAESSRRKHGEDDGEGHRQSARAQCRPPNAMKLTPSSASRGSCRRGLGGGASSWMYRSASSLVRPSAALSLSVLLLIMLCSSLVVLGGHLQQPVRPANDAASDIAAESRAEADRKAEAAARTNKCTRRYLKQKCRLCRSLSLAKFRRRSDRELGARTFRDCKRKKIKKRCGKDGAFSSFKCTPPTFTPKRFEGGGGDDSTGTPPPAELKTDQENDESTPTPATENQTTGQAAESGHDCNIVFFAEEYPDIERETINFGLVIEEECRLNWTTTDLRMGVCVDCPDQPKRCSSETNDGDILPNMIGSMGGAILGAGEEKRLSIPYIHEDGIEDGVDLASCSYSANFSATFVATTDLYRYRYRRDCRLSNMGLPDSCQDVPLEVYNERFAAEVILLCDEEQEQEAWCRELFDEPDNPIVQVFESALETYFTDVERCTYGNEECGPRDILTVTIDNVTVLDSYMYMDGVGEDSSQRTDIFKRGRKKKKRRINLEGKRRSSGRCRRPSSCASREKVDDSITPGRRQLEEEEAEVKEDYDVNVQVQSICSERPSLAQSLANIIGEGIYLEGARLNSILARNCSVDCGTDGECCGIEGCSCSQDSVTSRNCLVGTSLGDGNLTSCFLEGENGSNLCCVPTDQCPPSWEMQACMAECDELQKPSSDQFLPCRLSLGIETSQSEDHVKFDLAMTNSCRLGGFMTQLLVTICIDCSEAVASVEQNCIHDADIIGDLFQQTSSRCIGAYETEHIVIPVEVKPEGVDVRSTCEVSANFTASFQVDASTLSVETVSGIVKFTVPP